MNIFMYYIGTWSLRGREPRGQAPGDSSSPRPDTALGGSWGSYKASFKGPFKGIYRDVFIRV